MLLKTNIIRKYTVNSQNEYIEERMYIWRKIAQIMIRDASKHKKVVFDVIDQQILKELNHKLSINGRRLHVINIYASLEDLVRNVDKRRKEQDPRGTFVFDQFVTRYVKSDTSTDTENITADCMTVNRANFTNKLKETMKYEFKNEEKIRKLCNRYF